MTTFLTVFFIWWTCAFPSIMLFLFAEDIGDYIREKTRELRRKHEQKSNEA